MFTRFPGAFDCKLVIERAPKSPMATTPSRSKNPIVTCTKVIAVTFFFSFLDKMPKDRAIELCDHADLTDLNFSKASHFLVGFVIGVRSNLFLQLSDPRLAI